MSNVHEWISRRSLSAEVDEDQGEEPESGDQRHSCQLGFRFIAAVGFGNIFLDDHAGQGTR